MTAVSQANMSQGLLSWAPAFLCSGKGRGFLPQGNPEPGAFQKNAYAAETEWSCGFQCWQGSGLGWLLSSGAISQHHQVCAPNPACIAKDPFQQGWKVSDNTTAAVSLLQFCVESPRAMYH